MTSRLFTTYYSERRPERRAELDYCLALNAGVFDRVHVLAEGSAFVGQENVECGVQDHRQTYADLIGWAQETCEPDDLCVIANCDIAFPPKSLYGLSQITTDDVFALSRYDVKPGGAVKLWDVPYSQDSWVFRGPPRAVGGDYPFGTPGCDNRFAHELHAAGYTVSNPSKSIVTLHLHNSGKRTATNHRSQRIPPPYLMVEPTRLGEPPIVKPWREVAHV